LPAGDYARVQGEVIALRGGNQGKLDLSIKLSGGGLIRCDFIHIADHSDEVAVAGTEVSAHGINAPTVDELFPPARLGS